MPAAPAPIAPLIQLGPVFVIVVPARTAKLPAPPRPGSVAARATSEFAPTITIDKEMPSISRRVAFMAGMIAEFATNCAKSPTWAVEIAVDSSARVLHDVPKQVLVTLRRPTYAFGYARPEPLHCRGAV